MPYPVLNGRQINITGHYYNDTVQYVCNRGYIMTGSDISICQRDGYWSTAPLCNGKRWMKNLILDNFLYLQGEKPTQFQIQSYNLDFHQFLELAL